MFAGVAGFGVDFNILCMFGFFMANSLYGLWTWYRRPVKTDQYDLGVIVGKFYPPHLGHEHLVNTGIAQCKKLFVIVCVKPKEMPGKERANWLQENCAGAEIIVFEQVEEMDDNDSELWARKTIELVGDIPDACFTSESYGEPFAKALGNDSSKVVADVRVDQPREKVPVSGTLVRRSPFECWDYLSPNVRQYYSRLIILVGAESTGKTTLSKTLTEHFSTYAPSLVEEHGRVVSEQKPDPYTDWTEEDFLEIAETQTKNTIQAMQKSYLVIGDTDARATACWQDYLLGYISPTIEEYAANAPNPGLFIFCPVEGADFVQDGTRRPGIHRFAMEKQLWQRCKDTGTPIVELNGNSWEARTKQAIAAVNNLLQKKEMSSSTRSLEFGDAEQINTKWNTEQ